ncbi:complement factor B-like [Cynoglossus semilaevis]|uniref:complement factor B-like n=1 Tax=Cynoglossus semilaevis TaxID=244447 RepID=UPI00049512A8|nr:complement factor B-like [Cynoglossus semilaevis]
MGFSVHWSWFAVLSCLLSLGREVECLCTTTGVEIEGGSYSLSNNLSVNSILVYKCPEDHYPYPEQVRYCRADSKWIKPPRKYPRQTCKLVECPDPNVLQNGDVSPPQERYYVHNQTTYECYSGHKLRGSSRRVCLPNGKWSGSTPICSRDAGNTCADPGIPAGASRSGNMFGFADKVRYSCGGKLFLVGSKESQENGEWTGIEPACYYKYTYDTPLEVAKAFGGSIRETFTTLQSANDTQQERKIRITKNGTLNIYIAMDISESIDETQLQPARAAVMKLLEKIASFSVTPNYEIIFFSSEIYTIVSILDFLNGNVKLNEVKTKMEAFEVGGESHGLGLNTVFTTFHEKMLIIKKRTEENFQQHRHVIILFSDGIYNMGGSPEPTVKSIKRTVYMNPDIVEGEKARGDYLDIYVFAIGAEIYDDDLLRLTTGNGGPHYFRLNDVDKKLNQTFDEMIDESEVVDLCGRHTHYDLDGTKESKRKMYPWWAYIVVQREKKKECLGSLVTKKFVLTAAHCFTFDDEAHHVKVEIDDANGRLKEVEKIYIHPNYNVNAKKNEGVKEFYDYDVALIQLKEGIIDPRYSRPICIPCTKNANDALQLVEGATCKQHEELLMNNQLERLSFLTHSVEGLEVKSVTAKLGDKRDKCIRHALDAEGISPELVKDPKIPVTDNFLCTGGLDPYRDHIACTGDSGGAVFKDYKERTIQVALVSWGSKSMCQKGGKVESDSESRDFHINLFKVLPFLKSVLAKDTDDYVPLEFIKGS